MAVTPQVPGEVAGEPESAVAVEVTRTGPVAGSALEVTRTGSAALEVTRTGSAAAWADVAGLEAAGIRLVDARAAVVLVVVDGRVAPARGDVELIEAVSAATGRCAVGLDLGGAGAAGSEAEMRSRWRRFVHSDIPVGPLDAAMARTLRLLADGPARPITPTPGDRRRTLLARNLADDRAGRARAVEEDLRLRRRLAPEAMSDALESVAATVTAAKVRLGPPELDAAVAEAAGDLARALRLPAAPESPAAPERPRPGGYTDMGVGLLTLGAAIGAGGLLAVPLEWLGLPGWAVAGTPVLVGVALAVALTIGARRRRVEREVAAWAAGHLAKVRRSWDRDIRAMLAADAAPPPDGWRARYLVAALRAETGGT